MKIIFGPTFFLRWVCLLVVALSVEANAQIDPGIDAQQSQLRQQRERADEIHAAAAAPDIRLKRQVETASDFPASESPCFPVKEIILDGVGSGRFQWALKAANIARGRCLGTAGVNAVISRIQNALIGSGYVTTRVLAPTQDLQSGKLVLLLVPGRVREIRAAEPVSGTRPVKTSFRRALPMRAGDVINLRDVEQGLENFKRLSSTDADIQMVPGVEVGESDLIIALRQTRPWRMASSLDDGGSKSTGKYQANLTLVVDNPLALQDLFQVSVNSSIGGRTHGTRGHSAQYSVPYGYWLLAASVNDYDYRQSVAGAIESYLYRGTSDNMELKLSRVFWRDAVRRLGFSLRAYQRNSRNFIDDTEVEIQRRRMGGFEVGLSGKQFFGSATIHANISFKRGSGAFGRIAAPEEVAGEGTSRPRVINADFDLSLPLPVAGMQFDYQASWRAQWNRTALIAQDQFAIGGRYTVRGFDGESSLLSERGWLLRNDFTWTPQHSTQQFYLFIDHGEVGGRSSTTLAGTRLGGAGLGWRGQFKGMQYDLFAGRPIEKPIRFQTATVATGFNLGYLF